VISAPPPPADRSYYERMVADVRRHINETTFTAAWTEGRTMPLEQVIAYARECMKDGRPQCELFDLRTTIPRPYAYEPLSSMPERSSREVWN
jgi:hypothetical protein